MTLQLHDLPDFFGVAVATIQARSPESYRRLVQEFVDFYASSLFNEHWGETVSFGPKNTLSITLVSSGLSESAIKQLWKPFFDWVARSRGDYTMEVAPILAAMPARHWWDETFWKAAFPSAITIDPRPGKGNDWVVGR